MLCSDLAILFGGHTSIKSEQVSLQIYFIPTFFTETIKCGSQQRHYNQLIKQEMNQLELRNKENGVKEVEDEDFVQKQMDLFDQLVQQHDDFESLTLFKGLKGMVPTGEDLEFFMNPEVEQGHLEKIPSEKVNIPSKVTGDMDEQSQDSKDSFEIDQSYDNSQFKKMFLHKKLKHVKNNNVPKNLLRGITFAYAIKGKEFFKQNQKIGKEVNNFILNERKKYKEEKNWNNNLAAMRKFFSQVEDSSNPLKRSYLMRKMTHSLIRGELIPRLVKNKQIDSMLKSYLTTFKVQMLRCRNKDLMVRTETH